MNTVRFTFSARTRNQRFRLQLSTLSSSNGYTLDFKINTVEFNRQH